MTTPQPYPYTPESRVQGPAIALMVTGGIGIVVWLAQIAVVGALTLGVGVMASRDPTLQKDPNTMLFLGAFGVLGIAVRIIPLLINVGITFGAWKMMRLESRSMAMFGAALALVPFNAPCCVLTIPFGIWAIVTLQEPIVKDHFRT